MKTKTVSVELSRVRFVRISNKRKMQRYADQVWALLNHAYAQVPGGLLFQDKKDLIQQSHTWHLALNEKGVLAITVHKFKRGLKLVAAAKAKLLHQAELTKQALIYLVSHALNTGWMEVSEAFESFVMKYCQGYRYLISADLAYQLLQKTDITQADDQYHYHRVINGLKKMKLALGTPSF